MDTRRKFLLGGCGFALRRSVPRPKFVSSNSYDRINRSTSSRKRVKILKLHGRDPNSVKKGWRIKLVRKIRISLLSPVNILRRLRDAYVNMMLGVASKGNLHGLVMGNHSVAAAASMLNPGRGRTIADMDKQYLEILKRAVQQQRLLLDV